MENKKNKDLKALLPQHSANEGLWDSIESRLNTKASPLDAMPEYVAREELWDSISKKLDQEDKKHRRLRLRQYISYAASVAAVIALFLTITLNNDQTNTQEETMVVFTEEVVDMDNINVKVSSQQMANFSQYCSQFPDVCTTPEFSNLKSKWETLKTELSRMKTMNANAGDERLEMYMTRIQSDIQQLESQMMHMFM